MSNANIVTFEELERTDVISVELVPERKGLIIKHCEYYVSSRRHGTTVTRRYNDFSQLYDVLFAKYPYRAVCELPPKRVVVGGGSEDFLSQRREALQRWLSLTARHPVMAHDADLRAFLCDLHLKLDRPRHDEFLLAGTTETNDDYTSTEDIESAFQAEMEELRLMQLGLTRLAQIFERARKRVESERADIRELGAGLAALSAPAHRDLHAAATLARSAEDDNPGSEGNGVLELALDALGAYRMLCARLTRGLHGERAAAARHQTTATASLRARHRYALRAAEQEGSVARAYALAAVEAAAQALGTRGAAHARLADLWAQLHAAAKLKN